MKIWQTLVVSASMAIGAGLANAADKPGPVRSTGPTDTTPRAGTIAQPNAPQRDGGSCNSVKGCHALEKACLKVKGHEYKDADPAGSAGVCVKKSQQTMSPHATLSAVGVTSNDAFCHGFALCKELKAACQGTWKPLTPNSGKCID